MEQSEAVFWTFERDGEIFDGEFTSQQEAQEWADDAFVQECEDEGGWSNGAGAEEDIVLIEFFYDDEGKRVEKQRIDSTVNFEYYHGDHAEHFRQGDYL